jgi:transcriptional regulator with XRE-family HTH domain
MPKRLSHYFPVADGPHKLGGVYGVAANPETGMHGQRQPLDELSTRWRVVMSLEMQGMSKTDIAKQMGLAANTVSEITRDERYLAARDEYLREIDADFLAMKPLAFDALRQGLTSADEDTALKASDQWFREAGFGGYSKRDEPSEKTTAEDVVRQLLQINVQVNVGSDD